LTAGILIEKELLVHLLELIHLQVQLCPVLLDVYFPLERLCQLRARESVVVSRCLVEYVLIEQTLSCLIILITRSIIYREYLLIPADILPLVFMSFPRLSNQVFVHYFVPEVIRHALHPAHFLLSCVTVYHFSAVLSAQA